jgi:hypothetical protein
LTAVASAHLINYYPAAAGWTSMWTAWNPTKIDTDLAKAASLGANCVRGVVLTLSWFDTANQYLGQDSSPPLPTGNTDWTPLAAQGQPPANAAAVEIHLKSGNNGGTVWFDDVTITNAVTITK